MRTHEEVQRMLSAFLDDELTQADSQQVRIHLEDCQECRQMFAELRNIRAAAKEIHFVDPPEDRMNELEDRFSVGTPRRMGFGFLLIGIAGWVAYALYLFLTDPPALTPHTLIAGAIGIGLVLLLVSALRQRWLELPYDRYRKVRK